MQMTLPSYVPEKRLLGDAELFISDSRPLSFNSIPRGNEDVVDTDGSTPADYIPPGNHVLPPNTALAVLHDPRKWQMPSEDRFDVVRKLLEETTNVGELLTPDMYRIRHLTNLHMGGHQAPTTPLSDTRMEWWQANGGAGLGYTRKRGWYHGVLAGRDANGISNAHYARIFAMGLALIYEPDRTVRAKGWHFFMEQALNHALQGRDWGGRFKGMAKGEKGHEFIGLRGNGVSTRSYAKDWVLNLVVPLLLTDQEVFRVALEEAADFYVQSIYAWGGAWGARIPGRMLDNMLILHRVLPHYRYSLELEMGKVLDLMLAHLDKDEHYWPNLGNGNTGPMSPWMHSEAVTSILRTHEHIPTLRTRGPSRGQCAAIMTRVMDTDSGIDGGSELINGFPCLRYRFIRDTGEPTYARFLSNTAFALPALRFLSSGSLKPVYEKVHSLISLYAGCEVYDVQADLPRPITQIGYRDPRSGPAAPKVWAIWATEVLR